MMNPWSSWATDHVHPGLRERVVVLFERGDHPLFCEQVDHPISCASGCDADRHRVPVSNEPSELDSESGPVAVNRGPSPRLYRRGVGTLGHRYEARYRRPAEREEAVEVDVEAREGRIGLALV